MTPDWTKYRRVDECIECMSISAATVHELLTLMPDAYGGGGGLEDVMADRNRWDEFSSSEVNLLHDGVALLQSSRAEDLKLELEYEQDRRRAEDNTLGSMCPDCGCFECECD